MSGEENAAKYWTTGFGNMQKKFSDQPVEAHPARRALRSDWVTHPMPSDHKEIELNIPITEKELDVLSMGHVPEVMEDHWFMYFDGDALNFYRSWTGICVYQVHVRHTGDSYILSSVTVNRDPGQYKVTSDAYDQLVAAALVGEALGWDMSDAWGMAFQVDTAQRDGGTPQAPVGFWLKEDRSTGYLSNWFDAGFTFCGITFETAEHWIMWQKARVMGDSTSAKLILAANSPKEAKLLGSQVSPYDDYFWRDVREELAYVGIREKFLQNPDLAQRLMATGATTLAEASPKDRIWGVGVTTDHPGFANLTGWKGDNLQGRICMRVRSDLRLAYAIAPRKDDNWGTDKQELDQVLHSHLGGMSLISLTRNPTTRASALCYALLTQYYAKSYYRTMRNFLSKAGQATLAQIGAALKSGATQPFTSVGWYELLAQLAFQRRIGTL